MTDSADALASLEATLTDEIVRMYQELADNPDAELHFCHGLDAAEMFGSSKEWLQAHPGSTSEPLTVLEPSFPVEPTSGTRTAGSSAQFLLQPGTGLGPISVGRPLRDAERFRHFRHCETGEEPELDHPGLPLVDSGELLQRGVERQKLGRVQFSADWCSPETREGDPEPVAASFRSPA